MRKLAAILMMFPVAILFVGTVRLGSICTSRPETQCAKQKIADGCCSGTCHQRTDQHKDQPKEQRSCCLECPLCALMTFSPEIRFHPVRPEKTTEYAVMRDNPLSDYSRQHWKPPNPSLFS